MTRTMRFVPHRILPGYQTRYGAQQDVLQYIAVFYNNQRLHSYLGYKNPNQYEAEVTRSMSVA